MPDNNSDRVFDTVFTGSAYWQFTLKDGTVDVVQRRAIADDFLGITHEPEPEEMLAAKAAPRRRQSTTKRKPRRKARPPDGNF